MPTLLALPEKLPAPGILVINDIFGRGSFYEHLMRRLAQAGFVAADPEFFFRQGALAEQTMDAARARAKKLDVDKTVEDMSAALDWLRARPEVIGGVGTIGFCMGGTIVLLLAAHRSDIAASVCYYGFPADTRAANSPLHVATRMTGPILGHWGDQDTGVGMPNVEHLDQRLSAKGVDHEFHVYPGLGHGFLKSYLEEERGPAYEQACQSWGRTLDFYRENLSRGA